MVLGGSWVALGGPGGFWAGCGRRLGRDIGRNRETAWMQFGLVWKKHKQGLRSKLFIDGTRV